MTERAPSALTHLIAGVPVSDSTPASTPTRALRASAGPARWRRDPWDVDEHATLFIEPNAAHAGAGRITFAVTGLDGLLEHLATQGIAYESIETYSSGVRHVTVPDPDGNAIAFAELPG